MQRKKMFLRADPSTNTQEQQMHPYLIDLSYQLYFQRFPSILANPAARPRYRVLSEPLFNPKQDPKGCTRLPDLSF